MKAQQLDYGAVGLSCESGQADWMLANISSAARGDQAAFETLVESHKSLVCSIALAIVRDLETSEEIAQDVFIAAWKQIGKLKNPASFLPWLRQVTRNRSHSYRSAYLFCASLASAWRYTCGHTNDKYLHWPTGGQNSRFPCP
jgi:hypothetical protein